MSRGHEEGQTLRFQRSDMKRTNLWLTACHKQVKSSCGMYRACGVMFCNFGRQKGSCSSLFPCVIFKMVLIMWGALDKKRVQGVKGAIYWEMDGNRRYEVVTSCDHLHRSYASYSDRTQMPMHNVGLYADIWTHDKMFRAAVRQVESDMQLFPTCSFVFFSKYVLFKIRIKSSICLFMKYEELLILSWHCQHFPVFGTFTVLFSQLNLSWG